MEIGAFKANTNANKSKMSNWTWNVFHLIFEVIIGNFWYQYFKIFVESGATKVKILDYQVLKFEFWLCKCKLLTFTRGFIFLFQSSYCFFNVKNLASPRNINSALKFCFVVRGKVYKINWVNFFYRILFGYFLFIYLVYFWF